jgi:hypothetical protein
MAAGLFRLRFRYPDPALATLGDLMIQWENDLAIHAQVIHN